MSTLISPLKSIINAFYRTLCGRAARPFTQGSQGGADVSGDGASGEIATLSLAMTSIANSKLSTMTGNAEMVMGGDSSTSLHFAQNDIGEGKDGQSGSDNPSVTQGVTAPFTQGSQVGADVSGEFSPSVTYGDSSLVRGSHRRAVVVIFQQRKS